MGVDFYNCERCNKVLCDDMDETYICAKCKEGTHAMKCGEFRYGRDKNTYCGDCYYELRKNDECNFCEQYGVKMAQKVTCACGETFCGECFASYFLREGSAVENDASSTIVDNKNAKRCNWCPADSFYEPGVPVPTDACKVCWEDREKYVQCCAVLCKAHNAKREREERKKRKIETSDVFASSLTKKL